MPDVGGAPGGGSGEAVAARTPGRPVEAVARDDNGVRVAIRAERDRYQPGDRLTVVASVENRGERPAVYRGAGPALHVRAVAPDSEVHVPLRFDGPDRAYPGVVQDQFLQPGQRVEERYFWEIGRDPDHPVMPGPHALMASFPRGSVKAPPVAPLTAEVTVQIGGDPPAVTRARAREIAFSDPRVAEWIAAHAGPALVRRDEHGQWWELNDLLGLRAAGARDAWIKIGPERAEAIRKADLKSADLQAFAGLGLGGSERYRDGAWEVHRAAKLGLAPHRVTVRVDARDGRVLSVEFHER